MIITEIKRISNWTLLACTIVTLVILGLFYLGGNDDPYKGELWNPHYTGLLIDWMYILFVVTIAAAIIFAIWQFAVNVRHDPKDGVMGLIVIVLFGGLLIVSYTIGNETPLPILNEDAQKYNVPFWLKVTDMWLYSTYVMTALVVLAIVIGNVKKIFSK
jgi:hypothetical protein